MSNHEHIAFLTAKIEVLKQDHALAYASQMTYLAKAQIEQDPTERVLCWLNVQEEGLRRKCIFGEIKQLIEDLRIHRMAEYYLNV